MPVHSCGVSCLPSHRIQTGRCNWPLAPAHQVQPIPWRLRCAAHRCRASCRGRSRRRFGRLASMDLHEARTSALAPLAFSALGAVQGVAGAQRSRTGIVRRRAACSPGPRCSPSACTVSPPWPLRACGGAWLRRHAATRAPNPNWTSSAAGGDSNSARNLQPATVTTSAAGADIPLSAVDFHCSNLLEALISPGCSARAAIDRCARVFKTTKCSAECRLPVRTAANRNRAAGVASRVTCRILRLVPTSASLWSHQQIGDKVRELIWKKRSSKSNKAALGSEESAPVDQEMVQLEVRQVGEVPVSCLAAVQ